MQENKRNDRVGEGQYPAGEETVTLLINGTCIFPGAKCWYNY